MLAAVKPAETVCIDRQKGKRFGKNRIVAHIVNIIVICIDKGGNIIRNLCKV